MYRLTIQGKPPPQPTSKTVWRRVYRWGSHWGYLSLADAAWTVEQRSHLGSHSDEKGNVYILDSVKQLETSPPLTVDDVWEEEIVPQGAITHGTHWSIIGTRDELDKFVPAVLKNALIRS
jgi:hypothetical protein